MNENSGSPWDARLAQRLVRPLRATPVTPNHFTTLRLLFGVLAAVGLATGEFAWVNAGAFCFVIPNFLDHADGELARITGKSSRFGHYYDLVSDAAVNILLFIGIGAGLVGTGLGPWAVPMGALAGVAVAAIFYMRNEIEQAVGKTAARQPNVGGMEAEDVLYLLPVITLSGQLVPFLVLATVGAPLFALWVTREFRSLRSGSAA